MAEVIVIDERVPDTSFSSLMIKRKSPSPAQYLDLEEKEVRIEVLQRELHRLYIYFKELSDRSVVTFPLLQCGVGSNLNSIVALLIEESNKPLSRLVNNVYETVSSIEGLNLGVTMESVKNSVLLSQRTCYGVPNVDIDPLEDETESCLWCWESRDMKDMKFLPLYHRGALIIRRTGRKKIQERIIAVSEMLRTLEGSRSISKPGYIKASQKLCLVLSEDDIRLLVGRMMQKLCAQLSEKVVKQEIKDLIKQMEKSKRKAMEEEKELKLLQEEAERKKQRREREELVTKKEKEKVEKKKPLDLKKSVSFMERFVIRDIAKPACENLRSPLKENTSIAFTNSVKDLTEPVTKLMEYALQQHGDINIDDHRNLQFTLWRNLGQHVRANRKPRPLGIRQKPKNQLFKEIQLATSKKPADNEFAGEKLVDEMETNVDELSGKIVPNNALIDTQKQNRNWQFLQFDKSFRPAFYGIWPKKSKISRPRNPLLKDPELDYDYDSDEEWEEEDPGENLSDCDKEDDDFDEESLKPDDEDESEDGFFVPDGYLSENERLNVDDDESDPFNATQQQPESEELIIRLQRKKHLDNITEQSLRKNQPFIISNFFHEKNPFLHSENLDRITKSEQLCLLSMSWIPFPGRPPLEDEVQEIPLFDSQGCKAPVGNVGTVLESDLPQIVSSVQSYSQGINKVVESLQQKFPSCSKTHLKNKVREISAFVENRWQVKQEILDKLGLVSCSPAERSVGNTTSGNDGMKNITTFFTPHS